MDRAPMVFPIRFAAGDTAVQTTTRQLTEHGVLVRCLEPPPAGTALRLKLYLPGAREALQVAGVVREHGDGAEPGFWADFVDPDEKQQAQIGELLGRRQRSADAVPIGAIAVKPDNRAFPRYRSNFAVRFASVQDFVLEYAANISAGGVFVTTENPPPLQTVVDVVMELPGAAGPVPARGLVVHRVTKEEAEQRGTVAGIGVQFADADDEFRQKIDAAIAHILATERKRSA